MSTLRATWVLTWLAAAAAAQPGIPAGDRDPTAGRVVGVSPGSSAGFTPAAGACPTFSWTAAAGASGYALQVFRVGDRGLPELSPALAVELPAGASTWTPPADRCLAPGERYAWSVRAVGTEKGSSAWSEALLFEIAAAPSAAELDAAIGLVQRHLGTARVGEQTLGRAEAGIPPTRAVAATGSPRPQGKAEETRDAAGGGSPSTAVRGEVADLTGETYGVLGISNSPDGAGVRAENNDASGPDLVLGGAPVAEVTETAFSRDSASNLTFDFGNPGAGTMSLAVDGSPVFHAANDGPGSGLDADLLDGQDAAAFAVAVHTHAGGDIVSGTVAEPRIDAAVARDGEILPAVLAGDGSGSTLDADLLDGLDSTAFLGSGADDWVDEKGDAMTGGLSIDVVSGFALKTGSGDSIDVGGDFFKDGGRILHTAGGAGNLAVGPSALGAVTTGGANTAVGAGALDVTTDGSANVAVGRDALGGNTSGGSNTAVGTAALDANTTGFFNVALGGGALGANTTAGLNTAVGTYALNANTVGSYNVAVGYLALAASTTASANTAVGAYALDENTSGYTNVALGFKALTENLVGADNTAVGAYALDANSNGVNNVAVGSGALGGNTSGNNNTALGRNALAVNSTGLANVAVGVWALASNSTAAGNTAVGSYALADNTVGYANTAVGSSALLNNASGIRNVAVGSGALATNTTGGRNAALGASALATNVSGFDNVAVGNDALGANTASFNTSVGARSLDANTVGTRNVALGYAALGANTTASDNIAVGALALDVNVTGGSNVAVGSAALGANTTASNNTAIGRLALVSNTTGAANTALGRAALSANTTADYNTAIGAFALDANSTGIDNVAVGVGALGLNTTGHSNIAIGRNAGTNLTTGNDNIAIGSWGAAGESGTIRIGTVFQTRAFIAGIRGVTTGNANAIPVLIDSAGQLGTVSSSARFKEDIADLGSASERVLSLRPVQFRYKPEVQAGERPIEYGLIAEDVAEVFPELVIYDAEGRPETVRYHVLSTLLLNELQRTNERLRRVAEERDARLERVEAELVGLRRVLAAHPPSG